MPDVRPARHLMRIARRLVLATAAVVALWLLLCHYRYDETSICAACGASELRPHWYVGLMPLGRPVFHDFGDVHGPGAIRVSSLAPRIQPSAATLNLFPATHAHRWEFAGANPSYLFGTRWGGCVTGGGRGPSSPFAFVYLQDPTFVRYVASLVRAGTLTRPTALSLFEGGTIETFRATDRLLDEYWRLHPNPDRQWVYQAIYHRA